MELGKGGRDSKREDDTAWVFATEETTVKIQLLLTTAPLAKHNPKPKTQTK
jgi:hypothetical protein